MISKKFLLALVISFALLASPADAAWEDFNGNFETGDFSGYEEQAAPDRATIVESPSPVGEGAYAARFERQEGDVLVAGSNRSEIVPEREFSAGETRYFRHLLYLPYASIDWNHWLILCQWHDSSAGSPPLSLLTFGEGGARKLRIGSGNQSSIYYEFDIPGDSQWFELVYRITFGIKGSIEVWLDGKSLGEVSEIDTLGTEPTNWKLGNYRSGEATGTTVIYQDGVKITKSFFSNPPEPVEEPTKEPTEEPADDATPAPVAGPPAPSSPSSQRKTVPNPDALPCKQARREAQKARARLNVARRRKWTKRIDREAKRYRQAKRRVRRMCR